MAFQRAVEAVVCLLEVGSSGLSTTGIHSSGGCNLPTRHHGRYAVVGFDQAERDSSGVLQDGSQSGAVSVHCFAWQMDGCEKVVSGLEYRHWNSAVTKHGEGDVSDQYQVGR